MQKHRKRFQGVFNIVRFNWHFYVIALSVLCGLLLLAYRWGFPWWLVLSMTVAFVSMTVSLLVSYYIYDCSNLYHFDWLPDGHQRLQIVNINAGFDETSALLQQKFPNAALRVLDFYDPKLHTEVSIKRARKRYPPYLGTISCNSQHLPLEAESMDAIFVILAAHEIRNPEERLVFFKELKRALKPKGEIYIVEHLRDGPNFLAFTIGFLHFYAKTTWLQTFRNADLRLHKEQKITPFISIFTLRKNDSTL
jgi:ubiquinone/menaquinone biosynthesis C-methylase UbiE